MRTHPDIGLLLTNLLQDVNGLDSTCAFFAAHVGGKAYFPLGEYVARTDKKVGTLPTCSRRIFSPANFNQSCCRILVFASRRVKKVAKWKIGLTMSDFELSVDDKTCLSKNGMA